MKIIRIGVSGWAFLGAALAVVASLCAGCGQATEYAKLVKQIGRQVIAQRNVRLSGERADRVRSGVS